MAEPKANSNPILYRQRIHRALARAKLGLNEEGYIEVWKALVQHTGEGDVRDVFDLLRIQEEYVDRLAPGFLKNKIGISGGVELQYKLISAMEEGAEGLAKRKRFTLGR